MQRPEISPSLVGMAINIPIIGLHAKPENTPAKVCLNQNILMIELHVKAFRASQLNTGQAENIANNGG